MGLVYERTRIPLDHVIQQATAYTYPCVTCLLDELAEEGGAGVRNARWSVAISVFLMLYYVFVAFLVVYFATVFGYIAARANNLGNWYWIANVLGLLIAGVFSDRLLVRKPLMIIGALISLVGVGLFAAAATHHDTGYHTFGF